MRFIAMILKYKILIHFQRKFHLNNKLFWHESIINVFDDAAGNRKFIILKKLPINSCRKRLEIILRNRKFCGFVENLKSGKIAKMIYQQAICRTKLGRRRKNKTHWCKSLPKTRKTKSKQLYNPKEIKTSKMG